MRRKWSQRGVTLIELMVALVLSLVLVLSLTELFIDSKKGYKDTEEMARIQENLRYVLTTLNNDIVSAAYMGCGDTNGIDLHSDLARGGSAVDGDGTDYANLVYGSGDASGTSDTLSLRYARAGLGVRVADTDPGTSSMTVASPTSPAYLDLQQYDVVAIADCDILSVFMITNEPDSTGVIMHATGPIDPHTGLENATGNLRGAATAGIFEPSRTYGKSLPYLFKTASKVYSLEKKTLHLGSGKTRYVWSLRANGEDVAWGVESFRVWYGEDTDGDETANRYATADNVTEWDDVVSVRVQLTVNSGEPIADISGIAANGLKKTVTSTFALRNRRHEA